MNLKVEDLSKGELLRFIRFKFFTISQRDLVTIRIASLSEKADKLSTESIAESAKIRKKGEKLTGAKAIENHREWQKSSKKFDKALKIWAKIDRLYASIGIGGSKT